MPDDAVCEVRERRIEVAVDAFRFGPIARNAVANVDVLLGSVSEIEGLPASRLHPRRRNKGRDRHKRRRHECQQRSPPVVPTHQCEHGDAERCRWQFIGRDPGRGQAAQREVPPRPRSIDDDPECEEEGEDQPDRGSRMIVEGDRIGREVRPERGRRNDITAGETCLGVLRRHRAHRRQRDKPRKKIDHRQHDPRDGSRIGVNGPTHAVANDRVHTRSDHRKQRRLRRVQMPVLLDLVDRLPLRHGVDVINDEGTAFDESPNGGPPGTIVRALQGRRVQQRRGVQPRCHGDQQRDPVRAMRSVGVSLGRRHGGTLEGGRNSIG